MPEAGKQERADIGQMTIAEHLSTEDKVNIMWDTLFHEPAACDDLMETLEGIRYFAEGNKGIEFPGLSGVYLSPSAARQAGIE